MSANDIEAAREIGRRDAAAGFSVDDYPLEYGDSVLRDAWIDGWKKYHEKKEAKPS